jgi:DNA polymerase-3 subunit delta'
VSELYGNVVAQEKAVEQLRAAARAPVHAYLLVGPPGAGSHELARSFAASLLCADGGCGSCRDCARTLSGSHPDLVVRERSGPYITVDDAREIGRLAAISPVEGRRKVLVLVDFHLVQEAAPALLKIIEEPPPATVFVVLADDVPPELVTIASRCVRVDVAPIPAARIAEVLVAKGVEPPMAVEVAGASGGRLDRAHLLASDAGFGARQAAWREVPDRLDGRGATVATVADELLVALESALEPLRERQAAEMEERTTSRKELETRQRREQRRVRLDELRSGLAALAGAYRDRLVIEPDARPWLDCLDAITAAHQALARNPNETLLLQALLARLSRLAYSTTSPE